MGKIIKVTNMSDEPVYFRKIKDGLWELSPNANEAHVFEDEENVSGFEPFVKKIFNYATIDIVEIKSN